MKDYLNLIIQSLLILILIVITFLLLRLRKSLIKEKRVTKFAIDPLKKRNLSFFDKIDILYKKVITKLSKFLSKLKIFDKYSQKYEKYVDQTKIEKTVLMDFISNKIMIGLFAVTVTIISDVLRLRELDILQLVVAFIIGFFLEDIFLEIEYKQKMHIIE